MVLKLVSDPEYQRKALCRILSLFTYHPKKKKPISYDRLQYFLEN
jgi:hypothetical protein